MKRVAAAELETPRLRLRQFKEADHPAYAAMVADAEVVRHIGGGVPVSSDDAWRGLATFLGHWALRGYGLWAVELKATGELVGRVGLFDPPGWPGLELGWMLARAHWGRGYAREAAEAALAEAFSAVTREPPISLIRPGNERSIRLAEGLGAHCEQRISFMDAEALVYRHRRPR